MEAGASCLRMRSAIVCQCSEYLPLLASLPAMLQLFVLLTGHRGAEHEHCLDRLPVCGGLAGHEDEEQRVLSVGYGLAVNDADGDLVKRQLRALLRNQGAQLRRTGTICIRWESDQDAADGRKILGDVLPPERVSCTTRAEIALGLEWGSEDEDEDDGDESEDQDEEGQDDESEDQDEDHGDESEDMPLAIIVIGQEWGIEDED